MAKRKRGCRAKPLCTGPERTFSKPDLRHGPPCAAAGPRKHTEGFGYHNVKRGCHTKPGKAGNERITTDKP